MADPALTTFVAGTAAIAAQVLTNDQANWVTLGNGAIDLADNIVEQRHDWVVPVRAGGGSDLTYNVAYSFARGWHQHLDCRLDWASGYIQGYAGAPDRYSVFLESGPPGLPPANMFGPWVLVHTFVVLGEATPTTDSGLNIDIDPLTPLRIRLAVLGTPLVVPTVPLPVGGQLVVLFGFSGLHRVP